jgi:hypothetical protein
VTVQKTKEEYLGQYAEGWGMGNTELIESSVSDGYEFRGDPNKPLVSRKEFGEYHRAFVGQLGSTMEISGVAAYEVGDKLVACCLWTAGGLHGTGLITVGDDGVEREDIAILS